VGKPRLKHHVSMGADQVRVPLAVSAAELAGIALVVLAVTLFGWEPTRSEWGVMLVCSGVLIAAWSRWRLRNPDWWRHEFWSTHPRLLGVVGLPRFPLGENRHERVDGAVGLVMAVVFGLLGFGLMLHLLNTSS
jgi:hypothetical protein